MNYVNVQQSQSGIGVCGLLGVLFVALKLLGVITWSWWWVTMPFWIGIAVVAGAWLLALLIAFIISRWF